MHAKRKIGYTKCSCRVGHYPQKPDIKHIEINLLQYLDYLRNTYYSKLLVEHRNNIAETWNILRTVIGKHLKHSSYPNHIIVEGSKVDNKTEIANVFNIFLQLLDLI